VGPPSGHAEYLVVPEDELMAAIPEGLTFEEAAPGSEGSHYALSSIRAAKVRHGQDVLVYGATGSAAVQLLKQVGATSRLPARVPLACHIGRSITVPSGQPRSLPSGY
jgi:NADPH:quinone reductase-like Zn-dependent oxidoreductase